MLRQPLPACEQELNVAKGTEERPSDLSRAFSEDGARKTHIGGQALIEGI